MGEIITVKRAELFREWLLATLANDEAYYCSTLMYGIADGDSEEMVMEDLQDGFYDDDIDDTIKVYLIAKRRYGGAGFYVNGTVYFDEDAALHAAGYKPPERIYMKH